MASRVFPENLRKIEQQTLLENGRSKRRALQHWLLVFCEKKVLAKKPMCYNQTKFVKNELYMERFHGNGLKNLNSAFILKITHQRRNSGLEDGIKSLSWKFELNRTRNRFFKIKQSLGKNSDCTVLIRLKSDLNRVGQVTGMRLVFRVRSWKSVDMQSPDVEKYRVGERVEERNKCII